ncbi:MAG: peptidase C14 caspase catalytic subunit p20 [Bacteroidetes bacterium]|nr:peptidase C14 caspase catalytic subunit p20 [Bacteroidota bacterium]
MGFALLISFSATANGADSRFFTKHNVNEPSGCLTGDCANGYGTYVFPNGNKYMGDFKAGKPNGKGILYCANGNKYMGDWEDNYQQGEGKFTYAEGHEYLGQFQRNQFHGRGVMSYANGDVYDGNWAANKQEGFGIYAFHTGDRYEGNFMSGMFNGPGTMFYKGGAKYVGQWADNKKNGKGIFYDENGNANAGEWVNGKNRRTNSEASNADDGDLSQKSTTNAPVYDPAVKVWAVVVGVASYEHMPALRYTDDDAYQFYAFLKSPEGGALPDNQLKVLVDDNATRDNILQTMRSVFLQADENDVVLFYFSGHGIEGAFVPVDFDGYGHRLEHSEIRHILEQSHARQKLVLGDACHSGSLIGGEFAPDMLAAKGPSVGDMLNKYYKAFDQCDRGMALFMSSKGAEVSLEDSGLRSGVFSHFLIKGLKGEADTDHDKIVSIQELFDYVNLKVSKYTAGAQTPVLTGKYDGKLPVGVVRE